MEIIMFVPKDQYPAVSREIYGDDVVNRQSVSFRDNVSLGLTDKEGYYLYMSGADEAIIKAEEIIGERGTKLSGGEFDKILKLINDQENAQAEGFGAIFG
ncbi:MAG: hypothetical protein JW716_02585 [Candidatus Aenigmarchaeota archaeon]|nr:hypothetical protein [Candidatus Aenigmarchaeota archaeon]